MVIHHRFYVPEESAASRILNNAGMGTQALWCIQCSPNGMTVDAINLAASSLEEFDYEGHTFTPRRRVPLGPDFQAELPKRLLENSDSTCSSECELDSQRWLGERVWPLQEANLNLDEFDLRASHCRQPECSCEFQGTPECIRLHIKEEREALKAELGEAFCMWGFNEMGEIVADKWTYQEQSAFQELVRRNPESFWHDLFEFFPTKCMTDFVSYYFNVFVLRRRAIQNRVNPENIDSDDDEMVLESEQRDSDSMLRRRAIQNRVNPENIDSDDDEMVLESEQRDSDSMLESNEELGHDAVSEDEGENGSVSWSVKDGMGKCSQDMETARGDESAESSLRAASMSADRIVSVVKESPCDGCCGTSNVEDRNQAWELLAWETKGHLTTAHCVIEPSDKEAWITSPSLHCTQDELISTKGMMEEFFGSEVGEHPK